MLGPNYIDKLLYNGVLEETVWMTGALVRISVHGLLDNVRALLEVEMRACKGKCNHTTLEPFAYLVKEVPSKNQFCTEPLIIVNDYLGTVFNRLKAIMFEDQ